MKFVLLIWLTAVVKYIEAGQWKYCYPESCNGARHTLCEYAEDQIGYECNQVISNDVTKAEKNEIVKTHNELRSRVANGLETRGNPGPQFGGDIRNITWDQKLALTAQRWANQCIFGHDPCRDVKRFMVGQSVGYTGNSTKSFDKLSKLITNWYDEVDKFPKNLAKNFQPIREVVSHYTNIVWGNTTKVGCGLVRHYTYRGMYRTHLVCNYGARGNWIGDPVYRTNN